MIAASGTDLDVLVYTLAALFTVAQLQSTLSPASYRHTRPATVQRNRRP